MIIKAKSLVKSFGSFTAVDSIELEINQGECFGLLGPNGAGKSTFISMTYENVYKAMLATPIGMGEVVMGEMLWVGLKGAVMSLCVAIVLALCGMMANPFLIPLLAIVGFLVALPCGAMGLLATALVNNINHFQTVYSFIIAPLYFLSGIFFQLPRCQHPFD